MGQDYNAIVKPAWRKLKCDVFGLPLQKNLHASHHLHQATDGQILEVARIISMPQIKKFATVIHKEAPVDQGASVLSAVSNSVSDTVRQLLSADCECDHWIFEHSDNISRLSIVSLMEGGLPSFHLGGLSKQSRGLSFMDKKIAEPGLEIADLIIYLVGLRSREAPNYRHIYDTILGAAFNDRSNGLSFLLPFVMASVRMEQQENGTMQVIKPPTFTLTYLKTGKRAERRRKPTV